MPSPFIHGYNLFYIVRHRPRDRRGGKSRKLRSGGRGRGADGLRGLFTESRRAPDRQSAPAGRLCLSALRRTRTVGPPGAQRRARHAAPRRLSPLLSSPRGPLPRLGGAPAALAGGRPGPRPRHLHRPLLPGRRSGRRLPGLFRLHPARRRSALAVARDRLDGPGGDRHAAGSRPPDLALEPGLAPGVRPDAGLERRPRRARPAARLGLGPPAAARPGDPGDRIVAPALPEGPRGAPVAPARSRRRHSGGAAPPPRLGGDGRALAASRPAVRRQPRTAAGGADGLPAPRRRTARRGQLLHLGHPRPEAARRLVPLGGGVEPLARRAGRRRALPPLRHRPRGLLAAAGGAGRGPALRPRQEGLREGPPPARRDRRPPHRRRARPVLHHPAAAGAAR